MATNKGNINLTTLDFEDIKSNFKAFLKAQDVFNDYDFEASNINVLLDILSYNSYLNSFYLNMISNEMFLDSALLKDSIISHAKELNYTPRSFSSAVANVNITISDNYNSSVYMPKGTSFTGTIDNRNFTFVTNQNITIGGSNNTFIANNVLIYEGDYVSESYTVNYNQQSRYLITNRTVDTTSINVIVVEDNGDAVYSYDKATSLFGLNSTSQVFFIQAAENNSYEIIFGDGVIGRKPKDGAVIIIEYRQCSGELPNGIGRFVADGYIDTYGVVTNIEVNTKASGGGIGESIESIKYNAPRAFTTQERSVTAADYETLLTTNFSEINAVSAYGGEEEVPPRYGKVIVAVDLKNTDSLPLTKKQLYSKFLKPRSPLSIDPIFVDPEYSYITVKSKVKYDINSTSLKSNDIKTLVESAILNYNELFLNGFNKTFYYSRFVTYIDNSQFAIVSNDTDVCITKVLDADLSQQKDYVIDFGIALRDDISQIESAHSKDKLNILNSTTFIYNGVQCLLEDDGTGIVRIITVRDGLHVEIKHVGFIDYNTGVVNINNFKPDSLISGKPIQLNVLAKEKDIISQRKTILSIRDSDIEVNIEQVRI